MPHVSLRSALIGAAVLGAIGALPTPGHALFNGTFSIAQTNSTGPTCVGECGTVNVSGDGTNQITIRVDVTEPNTFIHGINDTVAFNVSDAPTVTINTPPTNGGTWSTALAPPPIVGQQDGFGSFVNAVTCNGPAPGNLCGTIVSFTLTGATAATLLNLSANSDNFLFSVKLANTQTTLTGFGGVPIPGPIVGAGLPGLVMACGGLLALARRRRQHQAV